MRYGEHVRYSFMRVVVVRVVFRFFLPHLLKMERKLNLPLGWEVGRGGNGEESFTGVAERGSTCLGGS